MFRRLTLVPALALLTTFPLFAQDSDDKNLDIRSSVGDLHVGSDVDAKKIGVPLYPGARLKTDDKDNNQANLSLLTEAFGFKLVVASYESNDRPAKVVDFYRDKLKRYGKVLECHSHKHGGNVEAQEGVPFCPHCSAPQIRVLVAEPTPSPLAFAPAIAVQDSDVLPASQTVPVLALPMQWSQAAKPCALAALVAALLMSLGLNPFV